MTCGKAPGYCQAQNERGKRHAALCRREGAVEEELSADVHTEGEGKINADVIPRMPAGLHRVSLSCDGMEEPSVVGNSGNVIETRMIRARAQASRMTGR